MSVYQQFLKLIRKRFWRVAAVLLVLLLMFAYISGWCSGESHTSMDKCIFCDIAHGKSPQTTLEVETDEFVIFADIKPASTYHYLAVPKVHYESLLKLNKTHSGLVERMDTALKQFLKSRGINTEDALFGFHLPPFISVKHLHMHAIAPRSEMNLLSEWVFRPSSSWFKTTAEAQQYLLHKEL